MGQYQMPDNRKIQQQHNDFEEERLKAFWSYVCKQFDILYGDDCTDDTVDKWYNKKWTIGFDGMTIEVSNDASAFNAIAQLMSERGISNE